jgi:DNA-binding FadR family transcriptional regulator
MSGAKGSEGFAARPIVVQSAAKQIARQIREGIASGSWEPGERLLTEHELAEAFGVSRGTVREALRLLSASNLVESMRGATGGTFVALPDPEAVAEQLGDLMALWFRAGSLSIAEVDRARFATEREVVRLAATNRTEEDLEALGAAVEESQNAELSFDEWLATDIDFHTALSRAAKNRILELTMTAIHVVRPRTNTLLVEGLERGPVIEQHRMILRAVRDGDADSAEEAFVEHHDHLTEIRRRVLPSADSEANLPISGLRPEDHPPSQVRGRRIRKV